MPVSLNTVEVISTSGPKPPSPKRSQVATDESKERTTIPLSSTREGSAGSAICESGFHVIETIYATADLVTQDLLLPVTEPDTANPPFVVTYPSLEPPLVYTSSPPAPPTPFPRLLHQTLGSRVDSVRRDAAWIPFYERYGLLAPQVAFVGVRVRNVPNLSADPASFATPAPNYLLPGQFFTSGDNCPLPVNVELLQDGFGYDDYLVDNLIDERGTVYKAEPDEVALSDPGGIAGLNDRLIQAAVAGAALVLVNDVGDIRVMRLGRPVEGDPTGLQWTLAPGGDVAVSYNATTALFSAEIQPGGVYRAYLVGRMLKDPNKPWALDDNPYSGPSQVVQVIAGKVLR